MKLNKGHLSDGSTIMLKYITGVDINGYKTHNYNTNEKEYVISIKGIKRDKNIQIIYFLEGL